jgi:hypothetical protein
MHSLELYNLLGGSDNAGKVKLAIADAIPEFKRGLSERGRSAPIKIISDNRSFVIQETHLSNLCSWYAQGQIDDIEIEYIASALDICSDYEFADAHIEDAIKSLSDFMYDGRDTLKIVQKILHRKTGVR